MRVCFLVLAMSALGTFSASAVQPAVEEFNRAAAWFDNMFATKAGVEQPCLALTYEDVSEGITRGQSWRGGAYRVGDQAYQHGIAFNATKHITVKIGKPSERFVAFVGLENNDDTVRGETLGNGSVIMEVWVKGKAVFQSPVMRRKDAAVHLNLPLEGATELELKVGDAGDGRGWDQAVWAEGQVVLQDGTRLRLQDLPWAQNLESNPFVFSFGYKGTNSACQVKAWGQTLEEKRSSDRTIRVISQTEPGGLSVHVEAIVFQDWPAVEWVVRLTNSAATNSAIIENIQAFDGILPAANSLESTLHWARGGVASFDDFAPEQTTMKKGARLRLQPGGGRSSSQVLPFFNLEGAGGGVITAIGWTGEWLANFQCDALGQVHLTAGMERTHLRLEPGESIRTPRMLMLFYEGDRWRGQNLLRQFILAHHRPKPRGEPMVAPITCGNWGATKAEVHLGNIARILKHQLPVDYYWIDAAWFGQGDWYSNAGNWEINRSIYPEGMGVLSRELRRNKRELMLWFEPERVFRGTAWHKENPEFLVGPVGDNYLFDLGNPDARKFLTDFISNRIQEYGVGCYRQDFNCDPLPFWRKADAPDRQGISEIRHIEGLYAFWDDLLARNPGLIIDNCASGGRRLDLETLGRATPFWRTDGPRDPIAHQCHSYGLLPWVPLSATSQDRPGDDYEFRSSMCSALCLNWWGVGDAPAPNIPDDFPFDWAKRTLDQYLGFRKFFYGDFYPLTAYSKSPDSWMAYQLDLPDAGEGMVVVLRRPESPYEAARFPLHEIEKTRTYVIRDMDSCREENLSGAELLQAGLPARVTGKPGSALIRYRISGS